MASCPLGFGGPGEAKGELSSYHCVLCRGLLHDPVVTNGCRHVFCAFCIRRFRDCPVCGADIESTSADTALASNIGKILLGHAKLLSKTPGFAAATPPPGTCPAAATTTSAAAFKGAAALCPVAAPSATAPAAGSGTGPDMDLPSVLLQLALQSLAGGNPEAALARLDLCADALCGPEPAPDQPNDNAAAATAAAESKPPQQEPPTSDFFRRHLAAAQASPDTASRLGVILGCKADCFRRLGNVDAARRHLAGSLACLAPWRGVSRETDSALSVTHNKLGDMLLVSERLAEAREQYERALEIRRQAVAAATAAAAAEGEAGGAAAAAAARREAAEEMFQDLCDLATSLCKVADVGFAILETEEAGGQGPASASARQPESGAAASGDQAQEQQDQQQSQQHQQEQQQEQAVSLLSELLSEARGVLLRQEMEPYARACGSALLQPPSDREAPAHRQDAAAAATSSAAGAGASKEATGRPGQAAAGGAGGGGGQSRRAAEGAGAGKGAGMAGGAAAAGSGLDARLVARYGKVWGALEQLTDRLQELRLAGR